MVSGMKASAITAAVLWVIPFGFAMDLSNEQLLALSKDSDPTIVIGAAIAGGRRGADTVSALESASAGTIAPLALVSLLNESADRSDPDRLSSLLDRLEKADPGNSLPQYLRVLLLPD